MISTDRITPVLSTALASSPYLLDDATLTPAGRRSVLRVVIDTDLGEAAARDVVTTPTAPLSLDDVADATRLINAALDESDVMGESPYTLEVTSPGVSRPLTIPRHFQRNIGRLVTVVGSGETTTGRLVAAGPAHIVLDVPSTKKVTGGPRSIDHADISRGEVQIEFNRPNAESEAEPDASGADSPPTDKD